MKTFRNLALAMVCVALGACATTDGMNQDPSFWANATPHPDIAGIVTAANEGEIAQGNAAASRATSAQVREFAQMMVADHTNALSTGRDLFAREGITPAENSITSALRSGTQTTITNLNTYSGTAFDRTYMRTQVDLHQWLLTSLDTALIPSARDPELRALLQTQRTSVAMHLDRARTILAGL
jgi:putative membrane protein